MEDILSYNGMDITDLSGITRDTLREQWESEPDNGWTEWVETFMDIEKAGDTGK